MPDLKPSFAESACFAALRGAILVEQQVLELDIHIVSARVQKLLRESLRMAEPASTPIATLSKNEALLQLAPLPGGSLLQLRPVANWDRSSVDREQA